MTWQETTVDDAKRRFIEQVQAGCLWEGQRVPFATLCAYFHITPKTGYKYLHRFETEGWAGLQERSRAPHTVQRIDPDVLQHLLTVRTQHGFGPVKLRQYLVQEMPEIAWPAPSTIARYLQQAGVTVPPTPPKIGVRRQLLTLATTPNTVWGTDFKGWCRTGDGRRCEPWTLTDLCSRYLLGCTGLAQTATDQVWACCEAAFQQYGLPEVIRTDNGSPFVTSDRLGLSRLTVWWLKLGVRHERIRAGCPQQNGRHERFHRTLKAATMVPPAATLAAQQALFDHFQTFYNEVRPHAALGGLRPAQVYQASGRPYTPVPADFTFAYPADWVVRHVRNTGEVKWHGARLFLSETLIGEWVAFRPVTRRYWGVYIGALPMAVWDGRRPRFLPRRSATALLRGLDSGDPDQGSPTVTDVVE